MRKNIEARWQLAQEQYAEFDVDAAAAMKKLDALPLSIHCWQGDDVGGFEKNNRDLSGGIQATGNYPGKARSIAELRADLEFLFTLVPGPLKLNLHTNYLDSDENVDRDAIEPRHFQTWIDWAKKHQLGLDFNTTFFSHPRGAAGSLSSPDPATRDFWIAHARAARKIGAHFGKVLGQRCVINHWIHDGDKDTPADLTAPRERLRDSLDQIFATSYPATDLLDALESKLFGIGLESYTVGSHEFYLGYAAKNAKALTFDTGHFHPTEMVSDKISAALLFVPEILLHWSRPVRWDSDHVLTLSDETLALGREVARHSERVQVGLDYFDASINRLAAWAIGARNGKKALLAGFLTPFAKLAAAENARDFATRLALYEETRTLPLGAVWDYYCLTHATPSGADYLPPIATYQKEVLLKRG
jgi:L-rhamnose isomerase